MKKIVKMVTLVLMLPVLAVSFAFNALAAVGDLSFFNMLTLSSGPKSFAGAAYDGRYVYYAPYDGTFFARYDTTRGFTASNAYSFSNTGGFNNASGQYLSATAYNGYVYYAPYKSGVITRYNTARGFGNSAAWEFVDLSALNPALVGFSQGVVVGNYMYFIPYNSAAYGYHSLIARYDTTKALDSIGAWSIFDLSSLDPSYRGFTGGVSDGTNLYLIPNTISTSPTVVRSGKVLKYNTTGSFTWASSWSVFDMSTVNPNAKGYAFGTFDGRYMYLSPSVNDTSFNGLVARFDTQGTFTNSASWSFFDMATINPNATVYAGAAYDGRYVTFSPALNGLIAQYDTTLPFTANAAWTFKDSAAINANSTGFAGIVNAGNYDYFVPNNNGTSGQVTRLQVK